MGKDRVNRAFSAVSARVFLQKAGVTGPSGLLLDGTRLGPFDASSDRKRKRIQSLRFGGAGRLAGGTWQMERDFMLSIGPEEQADEDEQSSTVCDIPHALASTAESLLKKLRDGVQVVPRNELDELPIQLIKWIIRKQGGKLTAPNKEGYITNALNADGPQARLDPLKLWILPASEAKGEQAESQRDLERHGRCVRNLYLKDHVIPASSTRRPRVVRITKTQRSVDDAKELEATRAKLTSPSHISESYTVPEMMSLIELAVYDFAELAALAAVALGGGGDLSQAWSSLPNAAPDRIAELSAELSGLITDATQRGARALAAAAASAAARGEEVDHGNDAGRLGNMYRIYADSCLKQSTPTTKVEWCTALGASRANYPLWISYSHALNLDRANEEFALEFANEPETRSLLRSALEDVRLVFGADDSRLSLRRLVAARNEEGPTEIRGLGQQQQQQQQQQHLVKHTDSAELYKPTADESAKTAQLAAQKKDLHSQLPQSSCIVTSVGMPPALAIQITDHKRKWHERRGRGDQTKVPRFDGQHCRHGESRIDSLTLRASVPAKAHALSLVFSAVHEAHAERAAA